MLALAALAASAGVALAAPGDLDTGFDGDGKRIIPRPSSVGSAFAVDVAVQGDGKIVVLSSFGNAGFQDFRVTRLNPDGAVDTGFGDAGATAVDFGGDDSPTALALGSDGKIVVVGSTTNATAMAVARLNGNGTLDSSFSQDGKRTLAYGGDESANDVAVQADGRIVLVGGALGPPPQLRDRAPGIQRRDRRRLPGRPAQRLRGRRRRARRGAAVRRPDRGRRRDVGQHRDRRGSS